MQTLIRSLLEQLGEDPSREGLLKTPERVEKSMKFLTSGYAADIDDILNGALFTVDYSEALVVDIAGFRHAAAAIGHRAGLLWCGDLAVALAQLDVGKGGKAISDSTAALELAAWSVSDEHARLREVLGVGLRGGAR
jgi:hypothetical protein